MIKYVRYIGLVIVFLWFFVGGIAHFTSTDFFVAIVPPWVPFPLEVVYVSGVFEVVLALLLGLPVTRTFAGSGLVLLTIAVTPANLHMWLNPDQFPETSETALFARLLVQVFLLLLIWWTTRPTHESASIEEKSN